MSDLNFSHFLDSLYQTSLLEVLAVLTGLLYVVLIAYGKRIGWLMAFLSTTLYVYLCVSQQLYIESVLQLFYVVMAVYGWLVWKSNAVQLIIQRWPIKWHVINVLLSSLLALIVGFLADQYTNQAAPYLDAFTTVFSLAATFMVAKKVLENWLYWIVIDGGLMVLYGSRGLALTAIQYGVFAIMAIFAYWKWTRYYQNENNA